MQIKRWESLVINGGYRTVALASRWEFMFEEIPNRPKDLLTDDTVLNPDINTSRDLFDDKISKTLEIVKARGGRLLLFSSIPLIHGKFKECNSTPSYLISGDELQKRYKSFSYERLTGTLEFTDNVISKVASTNQDALTAVIMSDILCEKKKER